MRADNPATARWLNHQEELTGPDGTSAVLYRRVHPTQESEHILAKSTKSRGRGGDPGNRYCRMVEGFYEMVAQGRPGDIDLALLWLRQQAEKAKGGDLPDLDDLMQAEQEADGMDDPLQLRLAGGDWSVADATAMRLMEQAANSERLARKIRQEWRERRMA